MRLKRGWTQHDLAALLKLFVPALSKIETGITDISLSRLEKIAEIFEMSTVRLLTAEWNLEDDAEQLKKLTSKLIDREADNIDLQKKVVSLYEQLLFDTPNKAI